MRGIVEQALATGLPLIMIATHELSALEGLPLNVVQLAGRETARGLLHGCHYSVSEGALTRWQRIPIRSPKLGTSTT